MGKGRSKAGKTRVTWLGSIDAGFACFRGLRPLKFMGKGLSKAGSKLKGQPDRVASNQSEKAMGLSRG